MKRTISLLLTVILIVSVVQAAFVSSSAAASIPSSITVNSSKVTALAQKATSDTAVSKLSSSYWYYAEHGYQNSWPHWFHISNGKMKFIYFGGGSVDTNKFSYQKTSGASVTFTYYDATYTITDIGLDKVLVLTVKWKGSSSTQTEFLYRCDRNVSFDQYGFLRTTESEKSKYRDYENYYFFSPYLTNRSIKTVQIKHNKDVSFYPKDPSYSDFIPGLVYNSHGQLYNDGMGYLQYSFTYSYYQQVDYTKDCCVIYLFDKKNHISDNVIYLVKQGSDYFAIVRDSKTHCLIEEWTKWFGDVPLTAWYYNSVKYVYDNKYMSGYSDARFGAVKNIRRQDFVMILARIAGADLSKYENKASSFSDVKKGAYYYSAVNWAVENGIIGGYSNGKFGVNDPIIREQVATILYRYMGSPAVNNVDSTLSKFSDTKKISSYAKIPLAWAVQNGIISGMSDGRAAPKEGASRAQIATIVMNMDLNGMFGEDGVFRYFEGEYLFTSGVGAWETRMYLYPDGTFEGEYSDWDGIGGDGYDATVAYSSFRGQFTNPRKVNAYTFAFDLDYDSIEYDDIPGTSEIAYYYGSNVLMEYSKAVGFDETEKTVYAYTPDAPIASLPDDFMSWIRPRKEYSTAKDSPYLSFKCLNSAGYGWVGEQCR